MAEPGPASFSTQANALLIKNITFQKRNMKANFRIILFPVILFAILAIAQHYINNAKKDSSGGGLVDEQTLSPHSCGKDYYTDITGKACDIPRPAEWPALLQIPRLQFRTFNSNSSNSSDTSCLDDSNCPVTLLVTGSNQTMAQSVANNFFPSNPLFTSQSSNATLYMLANLILGVSKDPGRDNFYETSFNAIWQNEIVTQNETKTAPLPQKISILEGKKKLNNFTKLSVKASMDVINEPDVKEPDVNKSDVNQSALPQLMSFRDHLNRGPAPHYAFLANIQQQCTNKSTTTIPFQIPSSQLHIELQCVKGLHLWRDSSLMINKELLNSSWNGIGFAGAYDFLNTNENNFNVNIWYNKSRDEYLTRVPRAVNLVSNAYLQFLRGDGVKVLLEFVKEMPSRPVKLTQDLATYIGEMFYTWVILQLFPVMLSSLVYEKQENLRIMMKMHGLGDGPYWMITYAYFAVVSFIYMLVFIGCGSAIGLKFFTMNDYSIQFVFYFLFMNLQIACAFFGAIFFSTARTATVISNICVFGSGLLAVTFFKAFVEDSSFPSGWLMVIEAFPGFALYRGIYEFAEYSKSGEMMGFKGMQWSDLSDNLNGMREILIIMFAEWIIVLFVAYYLDQVMSSGSGVRKHPLFFLKSFKKKPSPSLNRPSLKRQGSQVEVEKPDVAQERERVEQLMLNSSRQTIISDNIKKVYPGKDGNPDKYAVKGLSLGVPQGQCFGMLGPNGAGKTSWISMMIGLTMPSSGTAYVEGLDIRTDMDSIYTSMGVCPQHDLLWETLTGREHLLFYGRLKNLKGSALTQAVEESLKGVNLFHGGVADKRAGKYSGGMKRRLSVAISLIGDPKVVYLDEPSTGLDPASRNSLWNVVKQAKQHRAIILTTHSMEEADMLCDRLGIFVDGRLQCVGNSNELKARYGGFYVFTMTTSSDQEEEVENLVQQLSSKARKIYHLSGTQKFELPKKEVRIADVFQAVERAKANLTIHAWGLADTTLEDVFIKVARDAQSFKLFS